MNYSTGDLAAAKLRIDGEGGSEWITVCSAYLPFDSSLPPPTEELRDIVGVTERAGGSIIIGCDANSHHMSWGSTGTNKRGESLFDYVLSTNLVVVNVGTNPTFIDRRRKEVIDITLVSSEISDRVRNWHVSEEPSCSDHRHIRFEYGCGESRITMYRNPRYTDWASYKNDLAGMVKDIPTRLGTVVELEAATNSLTSAMRIAFEINCPLRSEPIRKVTWWNVELTKMRKEVRRLFNTGKRSGDWASYRCALTEYNKALRKAKRLSWRRYCEQITSTQGAARLVRILKHESSNELGSLRRSDGTYTNTARESLETLLEDHFGHPGDNEVNVPSSFSPQRTTKERWLNARSIFNPGKIKEAIRSFESFKAPGLDGILPSMLQQGMEAIVPVICGIFTASYALGHIPEAWRKAKIVFIPKPGRVDYTRPKAYRPISLTSFVLKAMEKVVDWEIRQTALVRAPLHPSQHAYRAGRSTESALHCLVHKIEKVILNKGIAVGIFLDIEGAFDNVSHDVIVNSMRKKQVDIMICNWVKNMLRTRTIEADLYGEVIERRAVKGCPQGGVLSPLLWSLVADELLDRLAQAGHDGQGYADDIAIVVGGKDCVKVSEEAQTALDLVARWCKDVNLSINPSKTEVVPFTRKRQVENLTQLSLLGQTLQFGASVKYLGVTLDSKLSWNVHLDKVVDRAVMSLWSCRRACGKRWGLRPRMMHWIYNVVILPTVTYGAIVWWHRTELKYVQQKLGKLQRTACLSITGAMSTTPTAAMETLLSLPPLHLVVQKEALLTAYRLRVNDCLKMDLGKGHSQIGARLEEVPSLNMTPDRMPVAHTRGPIPECNIQDRREWSDKAIPRNGLVWFTDGSRTEEGTGAGIWGLRPKFRKAISLGRQATVFQAEVFAILQCAYEGVRRAYEGLEIFILSDSKAAIMAVCSYKATSRLVWECIGALENLGRNNKVTLIWVPGHQGIEGNEGADKLAKVGTTRAFIGPEPVVGMAYCSVKRAAEEWVLHRHREYWNSKPGQAHTRAFLEGPTKKKTEELLSMGRANVRMVTSLITGHCQLAKHMSRIIGSGDPTCRLCLEDEETPLHILSECPALGTSRFALFGTSPANVADLRNLRLSGLLKFFAVPSLQGHIN